MRKNVYLFVLKPLISPRFLFVDLDVGVYKGVEESSCIKIIAKPYVNIPYGWLIQYVDTFMYFNNINKVPRLVQALYGIS